MDEYKLIKELVRRHNEGLIKLNRDQLDKLAQKAYQHGLDFDVQAKPLRKGLFDAADMTLFGMLPNEWRPYSGGQDVYGERGIDKVAGGLGSLAGLVTGVGGAAKLAPSVFRGLSSAGKSGLGAVKNVRSSFDKGGKAAQILSDVKKTEAGRRATNIANSIYNGGRNVVGKGVDRIPSSVAETASTASEWWTRGGGQAGAGRLGRLLTGAERYRP